MIRSVVAVALLVVVSGCGGGGPAAQPKHTPPSSSVSSSLPTLTSAGATRVLGCRHPLPARVGIMDGTPCRLADGRLAQVIHATTDAEFEGLQMAADVGAPFGQTYYALKQDPSWWFCQDAGKPNLADFAASIGATEIPPSG